MLDRILSLYEHNRERKVPNVTPGNGYFLYFLTKLIRPQRILEIGTANGLSTLYFAAALQSLKNEGQIVTIEPQQSMHEEAKSYFTQFEVEHMIHAIHGTFQEHYEYCSKLTFDLIFIDAMKKEYAEYLQKALPLCSPNGLIICDDVIKWKHKMENFYEYLHEHHYEHCIVPTDSDDGVMLIFPTTSSFHLCSPFFS